MWRCREAGLCVESWLFDCFHGGILLIHQLEVALQALLMFGPNFRCFQFIVLYFVCTITT